MANVSGVVLDLGEVMIRLDFTKLLRVLQGDQVSTPTEALNRVNQWDDYDAFERGFLTEGEFHEAICQRFDLTLDRKTFRGLWNSILGDAIPDAFELTKTLAAKTKLYALSNTNKTHIDFVHQHYPWMKNFHRVFTSFEMGVRKPDQQIYTQLAETVGIVPGALLFIDDREENIVAARNAGMLAETCRQTPRDLLAALKKYGII